LIECLFKNVCNTPNVYLSIIEREKGNYFFLINKIYVFFTRFRSKRLCSNRYLLTRFYLIKRAKKLGVYKRFNYCFSHTGKYSAILISSELEQISVDIEPVNRRLPESLKLKVEALFPGLMVDKLIVIMIIESLIKLPILKLQIDLSKGLSKLCPIRITEIKKNIFEVSVCDVKVYSNIYIYSGLYICITLENNQFELSL